MLVSYITSLDAYRRTYLEPRFTLRQAALAADFPLNTLRSNYQRGWFRSYSSGMSVGRGRAQRLCLGDVLGLAIASRLIDVGLRPLDAFNAVAPFALVAHAPNGSDQRRLPFQLFDPVQFDSLFVWSISAPALVVGVHKGNGIPLDQLRLDNSSGEASVALLLNHVEATVLKRLGLPASETLHVD